MHILFFSDNFPPEINAPASRTFEHAREWVRLGHVVTVITCAPNFPGGRVYAGYKNKIWQSEFKNGIRVIRVWSYVSKNEGFLKRVLDYMSYMIMSFLASFFIFKVDVVIGTSPQFFTMISAWLASEVKRKPFVFELRDIWPESIRAVGAMRNSKTLDFLERLELFLYKRADTIISVTHAFKANLVARGISENKIDVVTNGVDLTQFKVCEKDYALIKQHDLEDKFIIGYIGTLGMAHGLDTILYGAKELQHKKTELNAHIIFVGDGAEKTKLIVLAEDLKLKNVSFLDPVSKFEIKRYWSILDATVVHLKDHKLFKTVIPSKIFEAMAMGVPILHGVKGESFEIVTKFKVGVTFNSEDCLDFAKSI